MVRLALVYRLPALTLEGLDVEGCTPWMGRSARLSIGRSSVCEVLAHSTDPGIVFGGHRTAVITTDDTSVCEVTHTGHLNVARNGVVRSGRGGMVRHEDIVDLFLSNGEVGLTFLVETDHRGTSVVVREAPPRRDLLACWLGGAMGTAVEEELIIARDGAVTLLEHPRDPSHPDDARIIGEGTLSREELARAQSIASLPPANDVPEPYHLAGATGPVLVVYDRPRVRVARLDKDTWFMELANRFRGR